MVDGAWIMIIFNLSFGELQSWDSSLTQHASSQPLTRAQCQMEMGIVVAGWEPRLKISAPETYVQMKGSSDLNLYLQTILGGGGEMHLY